jgi:hypothetical protein
VKENGATELRFRVSPVLSVRESETGSGRNKNPRPHINSVQAGVFLCFRSAWAAAPATVTATAAAPTPAGTRTTAAALTGCRSDRAVAGVVGGSGLNLTATLSGATLRLSTLTGLRSTRLTTI